MSNIRPIELREAVRRVELVVFVKVDECLFFPNYMRKSNDYLLVLNMKKIFESLS